MKIEIKQIDFFDDRFYKVRYIKSNGDEVEDYFPSVTTKLGALAKPNLTRWYGDLGTREAERRRDEQADRGTRIHHAWYAYTVGGVVVYQPEDRPNYTSEEIDQLRQDYPEIAILRNQDEMWQMLKLEKFYKVINPIDVSSEIIVYDVENRDAGTADNIFEIEEGEYQINGSKPLKLPKGKYIIDVKTGSYLGKEAFMQIACYAVCARKMGLANINGALIVHTQSKNKKGIEGLGVTYLDIPALKQNYQDYRDIAKVWERNFGDMKPKVREFPSMIKQERGN